MEEIEDENSLTCTSRDNARVLRPVLRGARGETPRCPLGTMKILKAVIGTAGKGLSQGTDLCLLII